MDLATLDLGQVSTAVGLRLLKKARRVRHFAISEFANTNAGGRKFCLWCGGSLTGGRSRYCSTTCYENFYDCWFDLFEWSSIRNRILWKDKFICQRCKEKFPYEELEIHHIIPRSLGGPDLDWNLITLCVKCHKKETARMLGHQAVERKMKGQTRLEAFL